ncbi:hypothetical protein LTR85_011882 [Meristemomyces frigidus]|nr:hypothetical protein LTR85_011882 [Meristemomyces frigidus]
MVATASTYKGSSLAIGMARARAPTETQSTMDAVKRVRFDGLGYDPAALVGKRLSVQRAVSPRYTMMGLQNGHTPESHRHDALYRLHSGFLDRPDYYQLRVVDDTVEGTKQYVYIWPLRHYQEKTAPKEAHPHRKKVVRTNTSGTQDPAEESQDVDEADEDEYDVTEDAGADSDEGKDYTFDQTLVDVLDKPCKGGLPIIDAAIGERSAADGAGVGSGNGGQQSGVSRVIGLQLEGMSEMGWISYGTYDSPAEGGNGLVFTDTSPKDGRRERRIIG